MSMDYDWIRYGAGMVHMSEQRYKTAEVKFRELLLVNPSYFNAYIQLGLICKIEGRKEEAIALFEKATSHDAENEIANFQLGLLYMEGRNYDDAKKVFSKVLEVNPLHGGALLTLGLIYGYRGEFDRAAEIIEDAYGKGKKLKDGFARLGWIKTETKDWQGALELSKRDLDENRLSPVWRINLALLYGRQGEFERSLRLIEQAYLDSDEVRGGFSRLGNIKVEQQDWSGALAIMNRDLEEDRISPGWQVNLAQMYGRKGDFEYAVELIEQAYEQNPGIKDGFARLGWIKAETKDWQGAFELSKRDLDEIVSRQFGVLIWRWCTVAMVNSIMVCK